MSIPVVSELRPSNEQKFALLEDIFVRGGLRVVASADELKKVHPSCLKAGMVAVIPDPDSDRLRSVRLDPDLLTWTPCFLGDKGDKGDKGEQGEKGEKGEPGIRGVAFRFEDFTPDQLAGLKGAKGDPFTYADFTPAQLAALKGAKGDPFTFADFTPAQLLSIKGAKGDKGDKGDPFTYADFTPAQLAGLKGAKGDPFTFADFTPDQLLALKGAKGDKGDGLNFSDLTPEQIASIKGVPGDKGEKGDPFTYADFTPEQLAGLKGPKGDPFTYADFTPAQLAALKGATGDRGAAFTYADFTPAQLLALKGDKGDTGAKGDSFTPTAQDWETHTPYKIGVLRLDVDAQGNPQVYKALVANTSTLAPKDDPANWTPVTYLNSTQVSELVTSTLNEKVQHSLSGAHDLLKPGTTCFRTKLTQSIRIPAGAVGSNLFCETAATVASTVDVLVNGVTLFSYEVAAGATTGNLISVPGAETILNVGDTVIIKGGASCNLAKMSATVLAYAKF